MVVNRLIKLKIHGAKVKKETDQHRSDPCRDQSRPTQLPVGSMSAPDSKLIPKVMQTPENEDAGGGGDGGST